MRNKIISFTTMVAALLLMVGPWTLFSACPVGETVMKCHWCCKALVPVAVILFAAAGLQLLAKDKNTFAALSIVAACACLMAILLPAVFIGGCANTAMACRMWTFPAVYAISGAGILLQIIGLWTCRNGK